jgi:hypothetical protein
VAAAGALVAAGGAVVAAGLAGGCVGADGAHAETIRLRPASRAANRGRITAVR